MNHLLARGVTSVVLLCGIGLLACDVDPGQGTHTFDVRFTAMDSAGTRIGQVTLHLHVPERPEFDMVRATDSTGVAHLNGPVGFRLEFTVVPPDGWEVPPDQENPIVFTIDPSITGSAPVEKVVVLRRRA